MIIIPKNNNNILVKDTCLYPIKIFVDAKKNVSSNNFKNPQNPMILKSVGISQNNRFKL